MDQQILRRDFEGGPDEPRRVFGLRPLQHIENRDALLDLTDPMKPQEARWPEAEFIVGNPPFLGGSLLRRGLGDDYADDLASVFDDRLPRRSDLCCYWHE